MRTYEQIRNSFLNYFYLFRQKSTRVYHPNALSFLLLPTLCPLIEKIFIKPHEDHCIKVTLDIMIQLKNLSSVHFQQISRENILWYLKRSGRQLRYLWIDNSNHSENYSQADLQMISNYCPNLIGLCLKINKLEDRNVTEELRCEAGSALFSRLTFFKLSAASSFNSNTLRILTGVFSSPSLNVVELDLNGKSVLPPSDFHTFLKMPFFASAVAFMHSGLNLTETDLQALFYSSPMLQYSILYENSFVGNILICEVIAGNRWDISESKYASYRQAVLKNEVIEVTELKYINMKPRRPTNHFYSL